jgi:hypothetical protein
MEREMNKKPELEYVLLHMPNEVVLPLDDGVAIFKALARATPVRYEWSTKTHKRAEDVQPSLRAFPIEQVAALALNTD